ncbi:Protein disulfide-isomerase erp38 like protein [Verticillium longisporum]|uniref:Protein disulfide-isomerase erp38 like protein n=1 Tax=Verticillium longisporum TaxID=100787 RepID=A0A8I2ZEL5_VERLO|nr:Protein disulfide-isomerase erp38 like protein [Verticillium longisporum]
MTVCADCKNLAPVWEEVASDFAAEEGIIIAKVDADSEGSKNTAQAEGVTSYPTIKWFPKNGGPSELYSSGRSEQAFVDWINEKVGTHRTVGGGLDVTAGTIAALDSIVAKFTGGLKYAEYYVKVFSKLNASEGWAAKELARLDGILTKGGLAPAKRDELTSKTNILKRFVEQVVEKVKETKDEL